MNPLVTAAFLSVITFQIPKPAVLDEERMLDAIKSTENWDGRTRGKAGEWGAFQIKPDVWRKYSKLSERWATPEQERLVARLHLRWVRSQLVDNHLPDKPWFIAAAWAAGVTAVNNRSFSREKQAYADRAEAIYESTTFVEPGVP